MKKLFSLISITLLLTTLSSCNKTNQGIISTYLEGTNDNQAIEIYNFSQTPMDLSNYSIGIYKKTGETTPTTKVKLEGSIPAGECFVVSNALACEQLKAKSNLLSSELVFRGTEAISLLLDDKEVDTVGNIGYRNVNCDVTLIRKTNYATANPVYDAYSYIAYAKDEFTYLGEFVNSVTEEELLKGPQVTQEMLKKAFYEGDKKGTGGAVKVELKSNVDGDTANFYFDSDIANQAKNPYTDSKGTYAKVRYYDIDTAETYQGNIQEFGWPAKLMTAQLQNSAKQIVIQSHPDAGLLCSFGRILGYVFVQNEDDSYSMVNFEIIKNGLNKSAGYVCNPNVSYKGLPYSGYFKNAEEYAKKNKLGFFGGKDPYWDYDAKKSIYAK